MGNIGLERGTLLIKSFWTFQYAPETLLRIYILFFFLPVSKHLNKSKLSWNEDGLIYGVKYQNGSLVIQSPGLYVIICQLQFLVKYPRQPVDLKMELLINNKVKRQALVTVYESGNQTKNIYQNLSVFLLENLEINNTIAIHVDNFQYVDTNTFPLDNVLCIFSYRHWDCIITLASRKKKIYLGVPFLFTPLGKKEN